MLDVSLPGSNKYLSHVHIKSKQVSQNTYPYSFNEYSLSKGYFDPLSSSPPNSFLEKLEKRINKYSKGSR